MSVLTCLQKGGPRKHARHTLDLLTGLAAKESRLDAFFLQTCANLPSKDPCHFLILGSHKQEIHLSYQYTCRSLTYCVNTLVWLLPCSSNAPWVSMTSIHWYKATRETFSTAASLLDEDPIRLEMFNLAQLVKVTKK